MEQAIPIEECAKQRLSMMVNAFTLFIKNLMEEGLDRDKVRRASDRVWEALGNQAAEQLKPLMGDKVEPRRDFIEKHALEVKNLDI